MKPETTSAAQGMQPLVFGTQLQDSPLYHVFGFYSSGIQVATTVPQPIAKPAPQPSTVHKTCDVIEEMIKSKRAANRREIYIKSLRWYLNRFAEKNPALNKTTTADIESWLSAHKGAHDRATYLNRISTLFSFAYKRDYVEKNPCDKIERVTIEKHAPRILSPGESRTAYKACPQISRAWVVLCLWCGLRPSEAARIKWEDINLERGTVTVRVSKVRRFRIVTMPACAVELLRPIKQLSGFIAPSASTRERAKRKMRTAIGLQRWPQDIMRHTAASYHLAVSGDAGKVATSLGNSQAILLTHYNGVASLDDAKDFFKVTPPPSPPALETGRKYDYKSVRAFHQKHKSYNKTLEQFAITNSATLHYILKTQDTWPQRQN